MPRSMDRSSTIEFTPSNSDDNSYRDNAPMDDTINIKVSAAVAAEWIATGVGVLDTQANHDKNQLAHIVGSRVRMGNREALEDTAAKLEKNAFMDNNPTNHMTTQIIDREHGKTEIHRMLAQDKWELEEPKKAISKPTTKKLDEKVNGNLNWDIKRRYTEREKKSLENFRLNELQYNAGSPWGVPASILPAPFYRIHSHFDENRDPMFAPVGRTKLKVNTAKNVSQAPKLDRHISSPSQTLSIGSAPTFVDFPSHATYNKNLRQQAKVVNIKKANSSFDLDHAINNVFVPCSTDLRSTSFATAQPDNSAEEKRLKASLNIDRAVEAFRAHLEDARINGPSDLDSAIKAFRNELLHDKPAELIKTAIKDPASCSICGLTDHVTYACPKATCGDCGQVGHLGRYCPSYPCADCNQEGHIVKDCPQALECDKSIYHHNHQAVNIDNSPKQIGGMHSSETLKDCKGCWDGCDACCPELEDDANQQASTPVDPRITSLICSCGRCDSCLASFTAVGYRVRSPAPLPCCNGEMSFADLFQDLQGMSVQDDLDNLPDSNKENSDELAEVKLPKWGAFGLHCLRQGISPWVTDSEIATAPKSNDQVRSYLREEIRNQGLTGGSSGGWGPALPPQSPSVGWISNAISRPHSSYSHPTSHGSISRKPAVRQPSVIDLCSDSGCSEFTRTENEPLTITYSAILQAGGKTVNIPIDSENISGVEKEVIDGGMKKVWNWVLERDLGDKIDLQDAYELAKDMHGGDEEEVEGSEQPVIDIVSDRSLWGSDSAPKPGW